MEQLLAAENPEPERRARFIASFNRGYRSFDGTYTNARPRRPRRSAATRRKAKTLARDIAARYGN